jgi:hypothetical protein
MAIALLLLYPAWLGMMVTHELGHVLHAKLSGGGVERVHVPLLGFSQTFVEPNPRPHFVAWGGPIWACVIPIVLYTIFHLARSPGRGVFGFFAGVCLIANGAYIGIGWTQMAGDAGDLVDYGTPVWVMIAFGLITTSCGLFIWHLLTRDA